VYVEADVERVEAVVRLVAEGLTLAAAIARVAGVGTSALPAGEAEALLYGQILQAGDQGIWVVRDGRTRYANRRMAELMGYSVDELVRLPILDIFDPAALPAIRERTVQIRAGQRLHFRQELRRADGSSFLAEVNTTPLFNQAGRYEGGVAHVSDVTARNANETQALLRATLLDSIGEAVTATTPDGRVAYMNAAAERLLGWRAADVMGRQSRDIFDAADQDEARDRVVSGLREGKRQSGTHKVVRHDGSQFVAHFTAAPAFDPLGALVGFVAVVSDQTERDQLDRDLQTRERQAETLAMLGVQALRQRANPLVGAMLILTEAADAIRRLLHADQAMVLEVITETNELNVCAAAPPIDERMVFPSGSRSFAGYTALARRVVVVDNTASDQRFDRYTTPSTGPTASAIGAPIFGTDGVVGVLIAESSTPSRFDHGDAHFIQGMANIIGTALLT
jgi:PAS domain S-box-containing protein